MGPPETECEQFSEKGHQWATPYYAVIRESVPDHDKEFVVGVYAKDALLAQGGGKSKQEAEQAAARNALDSKGW
jgi:ribonuclease-3